MAKLDILKAALEKSLGKRVQKLVEATGELTLIVKADDYLETAQILRDDATLHFEKLLHPVRRRTMYDDGRNPLSEELVVEHIITQSARSRGHARA